MTVWIRIPNQNNHSLCGDAVFAQQFVVFRISAVRVDNLCGYSPRCGVSEIRARDARILRIRVNVVWIFAQAGDEPHRRNHLELNAARPRVENVVPAESHVFPALLAPMFRDVVCKLIVALGCGGVGFRSQIAMPFARPIGRRDRLEEFFDLALSRGAELRETKDGGWGCLGMLAACKTDPAEQEGGCRNSE